MLKVRQPRRSFGPADRVTLVRAVLTGLVAVLAGLAVAGLGISVVWLVALSGVALVLDNVDGRVARRTGTASAFGARFDLEVDAALILVLSVYVAWALGAPWVLAIGFLHYGLLAARQVTPWLRGSVPPRYWCKVVAAVQGVVLTVAASGVLPDGIVRASLAVALALLVESFGREVWQLWAVRPAAAERPAVDAGPRESLTTRRGGRGRTAATILAVALVWVALVLPGRLAELAPSAFARVPLELFVVLALALLLRPRLRRTASLGLGLLLAVLVLARVLDLGFDAALARPFDPLSDWGYLGSAHGLLGDAAGDWVGLAVTVVLVALTVAVLVAVPLATARSVHLAAGHRRTSWALAAALAAVSTTAAASGSGPADRPPLATAEAARAAFDEVTRVREELRDRPVFAREIAADRFAGTPASELLTGLRGKDVLLVFVESYGRVALEDPAISGQVAPVLDAGADRLRAAGFSARSGFLTSATFGGSSWLAHATLQSGLWVDGQRRHNQLMAARRLTLSSAFARAGWRTVHDVPANQQHWPEATSFYGAQQVYDARNVGYAGPGFGYATMPDQFTLAALHRLELARRPATGTAGGRPPVMAEVDLVSSHYPWTPRPRFVPWQAVGDGTVYASQRRSTTAGDTAVGDGAALRAGYAETIAYSLDTLISFVTTFGDPNLVLVVLGDHQPMAKVSGGGGSSSADGVSRDVPISVIAHDPDVLRRIAPWGWDDGLRPGPNAPVTRMDGFRDRFLEAFGPVSTE